MGCHPSQVRYVLPLVVLAGLGPATADAQAPQAGPSPDQAATEVLMTVSGGVSKGAYQGGFTWAVLAHMRRDTTLRLGGVGGASAGNINSLLSALEYCRADATRPTESLFWKLWIQTGIDDLIPPFDSETARAREAAVVAQLGSLGGAGEPGGPVPRDARVWDDEADGIFSRDFFHARHLGLLQEALTGDGWRSECRGGIPVGITVTSLSPRRVPLDREGRLWAATIRVASGYMVRFGDRVTFTQLPQPMRDARGVGVLLALPSDSVGVISTIDVFKLTEASSAFPVAFAPRALRYYDPAVLGGVAGVCPQNVPGTCNVPEREYFIDGGVFDNNPVDLIWSLTHPAPGTAEPGTRMIYVDPDNYRSPMAGTHFAFEGSPPSGGIDALLHLAESAVPAARQYELQSLQRVIQRYDSHIGDALRVTDRALPIYGDHLGAFAAFFGKPLRMHDYYVGIYDGLTFIASELVCREADTAAQRRCVSDRVRGEIEGAWGFPLDPTGQLLLRAMFAAEWGDRVRPPGLTVAGTARDSVLLDLLDRNLRLLVRTGGPGCDDRAPLHRAMCESGLEGAIEGLSPRSRALIRSWGQSEACRADGGFLGRECMAEPSFVRLVDDPGGFAERLTEELLERVRLVEDGRNRAGLSNQEWQVELAQMTYRSVADRYKRFTLELDPSTIPDRDRSFGAGVLRYVMPYYFMGALGDDGNELGWRPRLHLGPPWALDGLLGLHLWTGIRPQLVLGVGPSFKAAPWSTVNLSAVRTGPTRFWEGEHQLGLEGSIRLLTDKLVFTVRWLPDNTGSMFEGEEVGFFVGLADVNGLAYMIASALN